MIIIVLSRCKNAMCKAARKEARGAEKKRKNVLVKATAASEAVVLPDGGAAAAGGPLEVGSLVAMRPENTEYVDCTWAWCRISGTARAGR